MTLVRYLLAVVLVAVAAVGAVTLGRTVGINLLPADIAALEPALRHHSTALQIEQVRPLASLVTLEVPVSDVQVSQLSGLTGGVSLILLVRGDVSIATDLEKARFEAVDAHERTAVLCLPWPTPGRPRLDHEQTRVFRVDRSGLWKLLPGPAGEAELTDRAMQQAQRLIMQIAADPEHVEHARRRAETVLAGFFSAMEWDVAVRWDPPTMAEARP